MNLKYFFFNIVFLWGIAETTMAQSVHQQEVEKEKSTQVLLQQYLKKYKQDLNNAMDQNDYAASIASLNHILLYEPTNGQALYIRARGFENIGLYERAIFDFDQAQLVGYNDPQLYYFLARLEIKAGLGKESFDSFNEFFYTHPNELYKKELRFERGVAAKMAKEYKACVEDMSFVIDEGEEEADAFFNRGICFTELNILKEAKLDFKEAGRLKPSFRNHWYNITFDRVYKNNCKQSISQKLAALKKQFKKRRYFNVFILAQNGLKCYPDSKEIMVMQLKAMLTQINAYYDETIVFYQNFVKKHGVDADVQKLVDNAIASRKEISVSDHAFNEQYQHEFELPKRNREIAEYKQLIEAKMVEQKELFTALDWANCALRLEPKNIELLVLRAKLFLLFNKPLETALAWRDANQALKIKPDFEPALSIKKQAVDKEKSITAVVESK